MIKNLYHYNAHVTKVYDGDTITVDIDLGLGVWQHGVKIRLFGINTPELRGVSEEEKARGYTAKRFLSDRIFEENIILQTIKDKSGKYGRLLGIIWHEGENMNQLLISEGHAVEYMKRK